jgi:hypothetical protein
MTGIFTKPIATALVLFGGLALGLVQADSPSPGAASLSPERFARLQATIKPRPGEDKWDEIPWMTSLWQARKRAAAEGKPILLWEMDGHPLGCT